MNGRAIGLTTVFLAVAMTIAVRSLASCPAKSGDVTEARVRAEAADGSDWLLNGRTFEAQHFSPLKQITDKNASGLGLAWSMDIDSAMGVVAEPIVVDGVIFVSAPLSKVYAVEAASGKLLWAFDPKVRLNQAINGSYSARTNAGVAVWDGKVYVGTGDCRLVAIDAASGKQAWEATVCDPHQTGITGAPHVAREKCSWGTTVPTMEYGDRWWPTMQRLAKKLGVSGRFQENPRKGSKAKRWRWQRRRGSARTRGGLAEGMFGTPSRMTP